MVLNAVCEIRVFTTEHECVHRTVYLTSLYQPLWQNLTQRKIVPLILFLYNPVMFSVSQGLFYNLSTFLHPFTSVIISQMLLKNNLRKKHELDAISCYSMWQQWESKRVFNVMRVLIPPKTGPLTELHSGILQCICEEVYTFFSVLKQLFLWFWRPDTKAVQSWCFRKDKMLFHDSIGHHFNLKHLLNMTLCLTNDLQEWEKYFITYFNINMHPEIQS